MFPTMSPSTWLLHFVSPNASLHISLQVAPFCVSSGVCTHASFLCVLTSILTCLLLFFLWCLHLLGLLCLTATTVTQICLSRGTTRSSDRLKFWHLIGRLHPLPSHVKPAVTSTNTTPTTYPNPASYAQYRDPFLLTKMTKPDVSSVNFGGCSSALDSTLIPSGLPTRSSSSTALLTHWTIINVDLYEDLTFQNWTYPKYENEF